MVAVGGGAWPGVLKGCCFHLDADEHDPVLGQLALLQEVVLCRVVPRLALKQQGTARVRDAVLPTPENMLLPKQAGR